jgi:hypothetical protein
MLPTSAYCTVVLATPLALKARLTARPPASQAAAALALLLSAVPPTRTGTVTGGTASAARASVATAAGVTPAGRSFKRGLTLR